MKISEKKKTDLYAAIHEPIMNARIATKHSVNVLGEKNADDIDHLLYRLNNEIWKEVIKTLNINDG